MHIGRRVALVGLTGGLLGVPSAFARQFGCEPMSLRELDRSLDEVAVQLVMLDVESAVRVLDGIHDSAPCLQSIVPPSRIARFAQQRALVAFYDQDSEEVARWSLAGGAAVDDYPWPAWGPIRGHGADRVLEYAGPDDMGLVVPPGGSAFRSGIHMQVPRAPIGVPSLIQIADRRGRVVRAYWQDGAVFPEDLLGEIGDGFVVPVGWVPEDPRAAIERAAELQQAAEDEAARRAAACEPIDETALRGIVDRALEAISRDDPFGYGKANRDLQWRLTCVRYPMPRDVWAEFLYSLAVLEHELGGSWTEPLETALAADPELPRDYGAAELRHWTPPEREPARTVPVPRDVRVYVDGRGAEAVPTEVDGLHLVQRHHDGRWEGQVLRHAPFPEQWLVGGDRLRARKSAGAGVLGGGLLAGVAGGVLVGRTLHAQQHYEAMLVDDAYDYRRDVLVPQHRAGVALLALSGVGLGVGTWMVGR